jgi:hypothetical protein
VSASDAFGDSKNVTVVNFQTQPLSPAITFNLNCFKVTSDEVSIVRALADVLQIDITRIKVTSSYKMLNNTYTLNNTLNKPNYPV